MHLNELTSKIQSGAARIGIIGLGYTGLPLSVAFAKKFSVIGYDISEKVVRRLAAGSSHIMDVSDDDLKHCLGTSFHPTSDPNSLAECDFIVICVPTPLTPEKEPDLSYIKHACDDIAKILRKGQFIVLESTTYPGTTDEVVIPILEKKNGLKAGLEFGVAYSPERIDPGNRQYPIEKVPRVVGGIDEKCTEIAAELFRSIIESVVKVRDSRTAEAVKMMENIFRNVNIALVNEMSLIFERMGINVWEVIDAAATKPYGFMPFYPGPGVGGHCIPLDPFYMSYAAKRYGFIPRFIETAGEINEFMKRHVVNLVEDGLKRIEKKMYEATVAVMGLAYKKNIDDSRETPSAKIIEELTNLGANVKVYDPYVKQIETCVGSFFSEPSIEDALRGADCAVFVVDHDVFKETGADRVTGLMNSPLVIDCKNIFNHEVDHIHYLAIGKENTINRGIELNPARRT